ncbi:hypothetical protein O181_069434 [Austropuccinia psidii MF-1]|uniref:Integrase catalytic domain-containing protein n=1 Tax=Austropuccinia psidii MF-1 TaxID=1389203 RepID=A0A9Q3I8I5_9BASI|nr:hypothetical protein [Austropuccinia psidii MF-1]
MGPFTTNPQGFQYLVTVRDHASTYSVVYPLKSCSDAPKAILDAIKQFQVQLQSTPKVLWTDNAREFTSSSFVLSLAKLGVSFFPSLPYLPQENGEAEQLNRTLGNVAWSMILESQMPNCFWCFVYALVCFMHNRLPNLQFLKLSPYERLFGRPPTINTLYPFGADAIVHIPAVQQPHKLAPGGIACRLLKPLMMETINITNSKGSLSHIVNRTSLGEVPKKRYFNNKNTAISALPLTKDVAIPEHLGQALLGKFCDHWRATCKHELDQMLAWNVWEEVFKTEGMKMIGHCWVFDIKKQANRSIEKFKAWLVARGDQQWPGIDCTKTYAPTASLISLRLVLAHAVCHHWALASFDVSAQKGLVRHEAGRSVLVDLPVGYPDSDGVRRNGAAILDFKQHLCAEVEIKWHDNMMQIMGLECTIGKGKVAIAQRGLTSSILEAYPQAIIKNDSPLPILSTITLSPNDAVLDATPFCLVVGLLAYLVSGSHPDLAFAVNYLARHSMSPTAQHWGILDHVMGYLLKMQLHQLML